MCERVRATRAHHAAFASFSFCRSATSDAEIRVMAAEEGLRVLWRIPSKSPPFSCLLAVPRARKGGLQARQAHQKALAPTDLESPLLKIQKEGGYYTCQENEELRQVSRLHLAISCLRELAREDNGRGAQRHKLPLEYGECEEKTIEPRTKQCHRASICWHYDTVLL